MCRKMIAYFISCEILHPVTEPLTKGRNNEKTNDRNDDYITTSEISQTEFDRISKEYPQELDADRETAELFRNKYVEGHPIILEEWNKLL